MRHRFSTLALAGLALHLLSGTGLAQQDPEPEFQLTIQNIMQGPEHVGQPPASVRWSLDGEWVFFRWAPGGGEWDDDAQPYRVPAEGGEPERVPAEEADSLALLRAGGDDSPDGRLRVVAHRGDLFLIHLDDYSVERLTETGSNKSRPRFSLDGRQVFFSQDNNLFALSLEGGLLRQLTDVRVTDQRASQPSARPTDRQRFLTEQQQELFEFLQRQAERRAARSREPRSTPPPSLPRPTRLDPGERLADLVIEPGGRWVMLRATRSGSDAQSTLVPNYVTRSGYVDNIQARAKVGSIPGESRLGLLTVGTGDLQWLELEGIAEADPDDPGPDVGNVMHFAGWNADGTLGLTVTSSNDNKERWLHVVDPETGEATLVAHDRDEAWLAGPCRNCRGWMPDGETVYFVSERDGWAHLYLVGADGEGLRQLTEGEWEVRSLSFSPDREGFYLHTSKVSPFESHFYHMDLDGENLTRITELTGRHSATPCPEGRRLAVVYSFANRPPELYLADNIAGAEMERITYSPTEEWSSYPWIVPEIVHFEASDGALVPARIYRPRDVGAESNGAGVIFVHGAGYLQNVHQGWSTYYREYMFHHLLATNGFTVLDIDFRASAGYGRDWRTAIYRHMGDRDLDDHVDGARYLVRHEDVDSTRIGIYGGSYGGFITLMALFTRADHFAAGAALRSVTDWAHYNHGYTGNILNYPQTDEEAYRRSSPIYFAEGLRAPLLITHGMIDRNVQFQDVVRLAQRLIELGKTDWELAVYPIEDHAFVYPSSWTDQYRRIFQLFNTHLVEDVTNDGDSR